MGLLWGVKVFFFDPSADSLEKTVSAMVDMLKGKNLLSAGDVFVTTLSIPAHQENKTNTVQLGTVE